MTSETLNLIVAIKKVGSQVLTETAGQMKTLNSASRAYHATLSSLNGTADRFTSIMGRMATVIGGGALFKKAITSGFEFNSTLEQSRIGIAALIRTFDKQADAQKTALDIQRRLQIEGIKTVATYQQLLVALQEGIGPALKRGFNPEQVVKFTSQMTRAAAALSLPMDQLGQEIRSILDATIDRNSRVAKALGITNAEIVKMAKNGKLFEYLADKLKEFERAGDDAARTFSGATSNLYDALQMALGKGLEKSFKNTTQFILQLRDAILTVDEATGKITISPKIVDAFSRIDNAVTRLLADQGQNLEAGVGRLADIFANLAEAVLAVAGVLLKFLDAIGPVLPALAKFGAYLGIARGALLLLVGLPLSIYRQIMALSAAFTVLSGSGIVAWLQSFRVALNAAAIGAGALNLAFKGFIVFAAAEAIITLGRLAKALWDNVAASRALKKAQNDLKGQKDWADPKIAHRLAEISRETGIAIKSFEQLDQLEKSGAIAFDKAAGKWVKAAAKPKPTPGAGAIDEDALRSSLVRLKAAAQTELAVIESLYKGGNKSLEHYFAERRTVLDEEYNAELAALKKLAAAAEPDKKLEAEDKVFLLKQKHKRDLLDLDNDRHEAEKRLAEEEKRLAEKTAKEREKLTEAESHSQINRMKATLQKELAGLENLYRQGKASIEKYFADRKVLLEKEFASEAEVLRKQAAAETDPAKKIELETKLFELEENHRRALIQLAGDQTDAEKKYEQNRRQIMKSLADIRLRAGMTGETGLEAQFARELAEMDQRQAEEIQRLTELNATKSELDDAYYNQKREKERLLVYQQKRIWEFQMDNARQSAASLGEIFGTLYNLTGEKIKAFFYLQKTAAIAEAIIQSELAATKALGQTGIFGLPMSAIIRAQGMMRVAAIAAQRLAAGGMVEGSSPSDRADNIHIKATAGEFMQPVAAVKYYGSQVMEAIRQRAVPREMFANISLPQPSAHPSYALAGGGMVPSAPGPGEPGGDINIFNIVDPAELNRWAASSQFGNAVLNVMSSRGQAVRRILRKG